MKYAYDATFSPSFLALTAMLDGPAQVVEIR